MKPTTVLSRVRKAYNEGLLVELDLADGRDYSGYEVDTADTMGMNGAAFVITYGDYDDEREENAVVVHYDEVVDIVLI